MPKFVINGCVPVGVYAEVEAKNAVEALKKAIKQDREGTINWTDGAWEGDISDFTAYDEDGNKILAGEADLSKYFKEKYGVV